MGREARVRRRIRAAQALADVPPGRTLAMSFSLSDFARALGEAADRVD